MILLQVGKIYKNKNNRISVLEPCNYWLIYSYVTIKCIFIQLKYQLSLMAIGITQLEFRNKVIKIKLLLTISSLEL